MKKIILAVFRILVIVALVMPVVSWEKENEVVNSIMEGHHPRPVDLGLSVRWMSCNLGANSPEEYGSYYKWGETIYDAEGYRIPTLKEIQELINNCTWEHTSISGVKGMLVTGPNGNSIFLPAAGCLRKVDKTTYKLRNENFIGQYPSATPMEGGAYILEISPYDYSWYGNGIMDYKRTIRPVTE